MTTRSFLMSIGTSLASRKIAQALAEVDLDDVLDRMGLTRKRTTPLENLAYFGLGALAGAGAALLFAPAPGRELRATARERLDRLAAAANERMHEAGAKGSAILSRASEGTRHD
ncbi:MAG: YtxH domain-containing protein [Pseudomonadota bacterium]